MKPRTRLRTLTRPANPRRTSTRDRRVWIAIAAGALTALTIGNHYGLFAGAATAITVHLALRRLEPAATRRARERDRADLPFALDVFAACLHSGAPLDRALSTCAEAVNPALANRFRRAARSLTLGATLPEALTEFDSLADGHSLVQTLARSADTGARLADSLHLLAKELRFDREQSALSNAHRAGVWMVLPLCLCFLPAFIAAGLLPVVISSLDGILTTY